MKKYESVFFIPWPPVNFHILKPWSQDWLIAAGAYPGFCRRKRLEVFLLPPDGMVVHRRSLPRNLLGCPNNLPVPLYTPGWREALWELSVLPKNTTQCPWPGLEPGPLAPESSANHEATSPEYFYFPWMGCQLSPKLSSPLPIYLFIICLFIDSYIVQGREQ